MVQNNFLTHIKIERIFDITEWNGEKNCVRCFLREIQAGFRC